MLSDKEFPGGYVQTPDTCTQGPLPTPANLEHLRLAINQLHEFQIETAGHLARLSELAESLADDVRLLKYSQPQ